MLLSISLLAMLLQRPQWEDVSPNQPNAPRKTRASSAGLMTQVVGSSERLYAVSLNAGIWRSDKGGPWRQLPNSSGKANCIAIDPTDSTHLVVGERDGFAVNLATNASGVQESFDAGEHWRYCFDPLTIPGCHSQAVPAVAFDRKGNLYVGTAVVLACRPKGGRTFDWHLSPPNLGLVTAISSKDREVWARTRDKVLYSKDFGRLWDVIDIPKSINQDRLTFSSRGDVFSLAITATGIIMPCTLSPGVGGNRNTLVSYDKQSKKWEAHYLASGNGTGLGGRRFAKGYSGNVLYGGGQEIHQLIEGDSAVDPQNPYGIPVQTNWGGPYGRPPHEIHSDTWDMHLETGLSTTQSQAWIACDGGIFRSTSDLIDPNIDARRLSNHKWLPFNDGLHTHHIHTVTALEMPGDQARLAYPTSDNDAFYFDPKLGWMNEEWLGDVNWTLGDTGNPLLALLVRRSAGFAMLTAFRAGFPKGSGVGEDEAFTLCNDERYDGPTSLSFIQTPVDQPNQYPLLDAVRLVDLPVTVYDASGKLVPVPGPLGKPHDSPVLIRNKSFAAHPDVNRSSYAGWEIERSDVPKGASALWVSNGHDHPVYFVYANGTVFRNDGSQWKALANRCDGTPFEILPGNQLGPVFVNPYNPSVIYILAKDGVKRSTDGGASFEEDRNLTACITNNGAYPITVGELTGNGHNVVLASRANASATLAQIVFDRSHPDIAVACSPFTGVFVSKVGGTWRSLEEFLPKPLPPIVSVAIANDSIYCGSEGRGVFRVTHYRSIMP